MALKEKTSLMELPSSPEIFRSRREVLTLPQKAQWPGMILRPDCCTISEEQLTAEIKGIYAGLVVVEAKCINIDATQTCDPSAEMDQGRWQALIGLHRTLLYEHQDFLMATQHPSATQTLRALPTKYSMPARMWKHGIHGSLEVLRHRHPETQDYMLSFIYLAYQMMALLYETVPTFTDTWIECLGDLARYRMAVEEKREDAQWAGVAASWYIRPSDRHPRIGRLYHHLAILERPSLRKFACYGKSLTCVVPFPNARDSLHTLCGPIAEESKPGKPLRLQTEDAFHQLHERGVSRVYADSADDTLVQPLRNGRQLSKAPPLEPSPDAREETSNPTTLSVRDHERPFRELAITRDRYKTSRLRSKLSSLRQQYSFEREKSMDLRRCFEASTVAMREAITALNSESLATRVLEELAALHRIYQSDHDALFKHSRTVADLEMELSALETRLVRAEDKPVRNLSTMLVRVSLSGSGTAGSDSEAYIKESTTRSILKQYYDRKGDEGILRERLADLEMHHQDGLSSRELLKDKGEPLVIADDEFECTYRTEHVQLERKVAEATAAVDLARTLCGEHGIDIGRSCSKEPAVEGRGRHVPDPVAWILPGWTTLNPIASRNRTGTSGLCALDTVGSPVPETPHQQGLTTPALNAGSLWHRAMRAASRWKACSILFAWQAFGQLPTACAYPASRSPAETYHDGPEFELDLSSVALPCILIVLSGALILLHIPENPISRKQLYYTITTISTVLSMVWWGILLTASDCSGALVCTLCAWLMAWLNLLAICTKGVRHKLTFIMLGAVVGFGTPVLALTLLYRSPPSEEVLAKRQTIELVGFICVTLWTLAVFYLQQALESWVARRKAALQAV